MCWRKKISCKNQFVLIGFPVNNMVTTMHYGNTVSHSTVTFKSSNRLTHFQKMLNDWWAAAGMDPKYKTGQLEVK